MVVGRRCLQGLCDAVVVPGEGTERPSSSWCSTERCEKGSRSSTSSFLGFHGAGAVSNCGPSLR